MCYLLGPSHPLTPSSWEHTLGGDGWRRRGWKERHGLPAGVRVSERPPRPSLLSAPHRTVGSSGREPFLTSCAFVRPHFSPFRVPLPPPRTGSVSEKEQTVAAHLRYLLLLPRLE